MKKLSLPLAIVLLFGLTLMGCASSKSDSNNTSNNTTSNNSTNSITNNNTGLCTDYCPDDKVCVGSTPEHSTCVSACPCSSDRACVNGGCVDLFNDPNNCGAGGNYCSGECINGQCTDACAANGTPCTTGQTCCELGTNWYQCANTLTDISNCGGCGLTCDTVAANACVNGQCACGTTAACTTGRTCCSNSCKDLLTDRYNCGSCGNVCGAGLTCENGQCMCGTEACSAGESCCLNYCADLESDPSNCGECGNNCGTGNGCIGGDCTCGSANEVCRGDFTSEMLTNCMGEMDMTAFQGYSCHEECCDTGCAVTSASSLMMGATADPNNCGSCGIQCEAGGSCCCFSLGGLGEPACECCSASETCGPAGCEASEK
ncbi:MAG: hypothetical protein JXR95_15885 [Deltaproteobacteria bacterium]|nr:hypothetical protein [Deltaproteobacteria bacterium]